MSFKISDLSFGVSIRQGDNTQLLSRRPIPIPEFSSDFQEEEITVPMRIWEVSYLIYEDVGLWAFLAEWNKIPSPGKYFIEHLSKGTRFKYLPISVLKEYNQRKRVYNLNGAGEVDLTFTS